MCPLLLGYGSSPGKPGEVGLGSRMVPYPDPVEEEESEWLSAVPLSGAVAIGGGMVTGLILRLRPSFLCCVGCPLPLAPGVAEAAVDAKNGRASSLLSREDPAPGGRCSSSFSTMCHSAQTGVSKLNIVGGSPSGVRLRTRQRRKRRKRKTTKTDPRIAPRTTPMRAFFARPVWAKGTRDEGVDVGGKDVIVDAGDIDVGVGVAEGVAEEVLEDKDVATGDDVATVVIVVTKVVPNVAGGVDAGDVSPPYVQSESSGILGP